MCERCLNYEYSQLYEYANILKISISEPTLYVLLEMFPH